MNAGPFEIEFSQVERAATDARKQLEAVDGRIV